MGTHLSPSSELDFAFQVERYYSALLSRAYASPVEGDEPNLGGRLLYAGELDDEGRAIVVAANIAGAASLCVAGDTAAQKSATRDGIVDFVVTHLDEALRILKNELRKRQAVAVCVAEPGDKVESEMLERGVQPDLIAAGGAGNRRPDPQANFGAAVVIAVPPEDALARVTWSVEEAPALWMRQIDAIALACLGEDEAPLRRWLRLFPRYMGRLARGVRALHCEPETANEIAGAIVQGVQDGRIGVPVSICLNHPRQDPLLLKPSPPRTAGG
ncbi:MAG TPA: hypothetical protein VG225_06335 [Terracidiphilus sp.]|jgi:urocanate hydratase|nr:hypothetical protein [Terracidiphilus sp.]